MLNKIFLEEQIQQKVTSIGQEIVQTARPRAAIAPLQTGLAVQMFTIIDLNSSCKYLVSWVSSSYSELLWFQRDAASCGTRNKFLKVINSSTLCGLFIADNVDQNAMTIDGKGTFHGMVMMSALTPRIKRSYHCLHIIETSKINSIDYSFANNTLLEIKFNDIACYQDCNITVNILWKLSFRFKQLVPNWQEMMHVTLKRNSHLDSPLSCICPWSTCKKLALYQH